jgi:hypothetical protein
MLNNRKPATIGIFAGLAVLLVGAAVVAVGALSRVDIAEAAASDLDGMYSLGAVAEMEGALHEEGALAIAWNLGVLADDEVTESLALTDAAVAGVIEEFTFYETSDPIGARLEELVAGLAGLEALRASISDGTFEGSAADEYRELLALTDAALVPINERLVAPNSGEAGLLALDLARQASGEAVFESTAVLLDGASDVALAAALTTLDEADAALAAASPAVAARVNTALALPDAMLGAAGANSVISGESFDLFAWADSAVAWVLAYGDVEGAEIESGLATMENRAESAKDDVISYAITGAVIAGVLALFSGFVIAVTTRRKRTEPVLMSARGVVPSAV